MSYYQPPVRRPIRRKKDHTALILMLLSFMALPALGYAVWTLVLNKPPATPEDPYALVGPSQSVVAPRPEAMPTATAAPRIEEKPVEIDPFAIVDGGNLNPQTATVRTCKKIKESVDLGKSLVIWLFDRTPSCDPRREEVVEHLEKLYPLLAKRDDAAKSAADDKSTAKPKPEDARLLSVVGQFSSDVEFPIAEPTDDPEAILSAMRGIKSTGAGNTENTFGAVEKAVAKFADFAAPPHKRYLTVVVVTDEVGNDQAERDKTVAAVQKLSIPVFVIGQSATFGSYGNQTVGAEGKDYFQGPETRELEAPPTDGIAAAMGGQECGIGPYSLVHLCRESGGEYYAASSLGGATTLPPAYQPKYMSEKDYQQYRSGNKALQALIEAAALPPAKAVGGVESSFGVDENGQPTVTDVDRAQRPVALIMPGIDKVFETLKKGEADRAKLVEPRQQAEFDLALGRAMAMKVRAEGYIVLLAAFKAGRKGTKPETRLWSITPADGIEKNSVLDGMSKKAREYLQGVIDKHPNTPWAAAAQQELSQPIGWAWQES